MSARLVGGWLQTPYVGSDFASTEIGVGTDRPEKWLPAFLGFDTDGSRIAKVRWSTRRPRNVWLRVDGHVGPVQRVT